MQVGVGSQMGMGNLGAGRKVERGLLSVEKHRTLLRLRHALQKCPERMPMHHADAVMPLWPESQSIHVAAPIQCMAGARIVTVGHAS